MDWDRPWDLCRWTGWRRKESLGGEPGGNAKQEEGKLRGGTGEAQEKGPEKEVQSVVASAADRATRGFGTSGSRK